jgi:hypothetical protein
VQWLASITLLGQLSVSTATIQVQTLATWQDQTFCAAGCVTLGKAAELRRDLPTADVVVTSHVCAWAGAAASESRGIRGSWRPAPGVRGRSDQGAPAVHHPSAPYQGLRSSTTHIMLATTA